MRKVLFLSLLLIAVTGLVAVPASADTIMYNFGWSGGGLGTITASGGGLLGSGIGIDFLKVTNVTTTVTNNYGIAGGSLDFNTLLGTFSITGDAGAFGSGTLISGTMTGTPSGCGATDLSCSWNFTVLSSNLGSGFGFAMGNGQGPAGGPWTTNSQTVQTFATPEPASLALLASGLVFVGGSFRRKLRR